MDFPLPCLITGGFLENQVLWKLEKLLISNGPSGKSLNNLETKQIIKILYTLHT